MKRRILYSSGSFILRHPTEWPQCEWWVQGVGYWEGEFYNALCRKKSQKQKWLWKTTNNFLLTPSFLFSHLPIYTFLSRSIPLPTFSLWRLLSRGQPHDRLPLDAMTHFNRFTQYLWVRITISVNEQPLNFQVKPQLNMIYSHAVMFKWITVFLLYILH